MATFTTEQVEKLEMVLGYSSPSTTVRTQLTANYTEVVKSKALEILTDLDNIDVKLREATENSYVIESRSTKLSYAQHVRHLKFEGYRLLRELAYILCVGVVYDKYSSNTSKSYW